MKLIITAEDVETAQNNRYGKNCSYLPSCQCVVTVAARRQFEDDRITSAYDCIFRNEELPGPPYHRQIKTFTIPVGLRWLMMKFDYKEIMGEEMIGEWEEVTL